MFTISREKLDFKLDKDAKVAFEFLLRIFRLEYKNIYLVGGCVRDALLGKAPKDIDLTTEATPEQMILLKNEHDHFDEWDIIETGLKHGTVTFYHKPTKISFEVTTFRADVGYEDHRHPDKVEFSTSLEEDLKRRDLTINSFAYDYYANTLYMLDESYLYDLSFGIIRAVGDAKARFEEDALRMLRAIRFAAQLGFSLDQSTFDAIKELSSTITYVSHERIRDEMTKIIMSDYPQMLELLSLTNLDKYLNLPITEMINEPQHNKYHYADVFHHTMDVIKATLKDFEIRWAAFFHDFGKMVTVSTDDEGWQHYYGHPEVSANFAKFWMQDYKFDSASLEHIHTLVKYHDAGIGYQVKKKGMKKLIANVGEDLMPKFFKLTFADRLAHRLDNTAFSISQLDSGKKKYIDLLMTPEPMRIKDLAVNGNDLIDIGIFGKSIGLTLNYLLEVVLESPDKNDKSVLLELAKQYNK